MIVVDLIMVIIMLTVVFILALFLFFCTFRYFDNPFLTIRLWYSLALLLFLLYLFTISPFHQIILESLWRYIISFSALVIITLFVFSYHKIYR